MFLEIIKNKNDSIIIPTQLINKFFDDKIDVNIQSDVNEFYLSVLDVLEDNLKTTKNKNIIKYFWANFTKIFLWQNLEKLAKWRNFGEMAKFWRNGKILAKWQNFGEINNFIKKERTSFK